MLTQAEIGKISDCDIVASPSSEMDNLLFGLTSLTTAPVPRAVADPYVHQSELREMKSRGPF